MNAILQVGISSDFVFFEHLCSDKWPKRVDILPILLPCGGKAIKRIISGVSGREEPLVSRVTSTSEWQLAIAFFESHRDAAIVVVANFTTPIVSSLENVQIRSGSSNLGSNLLGYFPPLETLLAGAEFTGQIEVLTVGTSGRILRHDTSLLAMATVIA